MRIIDWGAKSAGFVWRVGGKLALTSREFSVGFYSPGITEQVIFISTESL